MPVLRRQPDAHWAQLAAADNDWGRSNAPSMARIATICQIVSSTQPLKSKADLIRTLLQPLRNFQEELLLLLDDVLGHVYLDTHDPTVNAIPLLLTLSMFDAEKDRLFAIAIANPVQRQLTTETWLQMLASIVPWAVNSSLSPQQASALLTAPAITAYEKGPFRSNTLLTALHNSAAWFVDLYVMHVAGAALPDDVKAALLSGSNEKETKDCMKSADAATREAYERQVSASLLAGPVEQDLLRYC